MSNCCSTPERSADPRVDAVCPLSRTRGKQVDLVTVKALLTETQLARLQPTSHYFCPDATCDIVYFDAGGQTYSTSHVRVPVWQKMPPGGRTVCYCLGENETSIRIEMERLGRSDAVERVRRHIEAGRCACEVRNPRGACCLGDVTAAVKRVALAMQTAKSEVNVRGSLHDDPATANVSDR